MGMMLPPRETPADEVRALMARKENIEAELDAQLSILKANSSTLNSPLLDPEGFPRSDIDVWAVRHARVRIIELRNDLSALMDTIMTALQGVYNPASILKSEEAEVEMKSSPVTELQPFAKGLMRDDLVVSFGSLTRASFSSTSLQPLADLVAAQENREISVQILRPPEETITLRFTPRSGWGGRGLLGCHIVPYTPS
ncbi:hypothetical protein AcV5_007768 [Taiwanofungus camphoratus]|nr:hypothetical protein AcV5_007768 [Antrodia cinnamomea]